MAVLYALQVIIAASFVKSLKKLNVVKEEDVNYIHLHHFKKITTNLFSLVTILKMVNVIMSLRRQCLMYQLIRYLSCLFLQIKILSKAVSTNSFYKRRGDRSQVLSLEVQFKQNNSLFKKPSWLGSGKQVRQELLVLIRSPTIFKEPICSPCIIKKYILSFIL